MYKLLSQGDFFDKEILRKKMKYFKDKYNFDGFELIKYTDSDETDIKDDIIGYHMRFFPSWLEFYMGDLQAIYDELQDDKYFKSLCGGVKDKQELIDYYKKELRIAKNLNVKYVVFHATNVKITESFTYDFKYSDFEVLRQVIKIINEIFTDEYDFKLLFENLWWSGLHLTSKNEIEYLLNNINYKNVGFILDTGHMINNNIEIKNSQQAVDYILQNLKNIGEYKNYIYGMHLNYSLSGEYVKSTIEKYKEKNFDINRVMDSIYTHISLIDRHKAFTDRGIIKIIKSLPNLEFLVFELIGKDEKEYEELVKIQNDILFSK